MTLQMEEKFNELRKSFWHDTWTEKQISELVDAITRSGDNLASGDFRKKSDWIFDSFLIDVLARYKSQLEVDTREKLFKLLSTEKNIVVSLESQEKQTTPGTLSTKSRKKVICGSRIPAIVSDNHIASDLLKEFSLMQTFFANTRAFDFISSKSIVTTLCENLTSFQYIKVDKQARQRLGTFPAIRRSVDEVMAKPPSEFCEILLNKIEKYPSDEAYLADRLAECLPIADFTSKSVMPDQKIYASFLRESLLKLYSCLKIPTKKDCLYRMFPNLVALLVAVQDIEMIRYLAQALKVEVGPFKWNSWDFTVRTLTLKELTWKNVQITCFKSPIISAGYYRNTELINLFTISSKLTTTQLEQITKPPEAMKSQIWEHEIHRHFDKSRTEFWSGDPNHAVVKLFSCLEKCNLTVEEVNRVLCEDVIKRESDWIFVSFLFSFLTRTKFSQNTFIVKALLGTSNMVANFKFVDQHRIPGTLQTQCRMKVFGSSENLDIFVKFAEKEHDFSLFGEFFGKAPAFSFLSHGEILRAFGKVLKGYPKHHEQIRETISTTSLLKNSITTIMESEPSIFCESLLESKTRVYRDSVATEILEDKIPPMLLLQTTFLWSHKLSAALVREGMRRFEYPLQVLEEKICLYRMFPELMALLVAVEDLKMIQYLSFALNVPIGPFQWLPKDFMRVGSRCLLRSNQTNFSYFTSPIVTAGQYQNQDIIRELSKSSPLTADQMDDILNPPEQAKRCIWKCNLQKVFVQLRKKFWNDTSTDDRVVEDLLMCIPYNATIDELKEILLTESISLKSDWAFISFLLAYLDENSGSARQRLKEVFWDYPNILATFETFSYKQIPGTANCEGNMKVLNNKEKNILMSRYEVPSLYGGNPEIFLIFFSKYKINPQSFVLIEPEHFIQLLLFIFPTESSNIRLYKIQKTVLETPLFEDKMKEFLDSTSLKLCDKLLWTGNIDDTKLTHRVVNEIAQEVLTVNSKHVLASLVRAALLDLDVTPYLLEENIEPPPTSWKKRVKEFFLGKSKIKQHEESAPVVPNCLYRKFPTLVALLAAAQDEPLIKSVADYLQIPVGPFKWKQNDFKPDVFNRFAKEKLQFPIEPIVTAVLKENDELIKVFSKSCRFKERYKNIIGRNALPWSNQPYYQDQINFQKYRRNW